MNNLSSCIYAPAFSREASRVLAQGQSTLPELDLGRLASPSQLATLLRPSNRWPFLIPILHLPEPCSGGNPQQFLSCKL